MDKKYVMLGKIMEKIIGLPLEILGVLYDLVEKLAGESQEWLNELKKFLRKEKCWVNTLLEFAGTVTIPATTKKVVVRDYIERIRKTRKLYTGSNFEKLFFGKTIEPIGKSTLCYHKLRKGLVDKLILAELGDNGKAETALSEMFALMEIQPNGEAGTLLANGYANIFYIRDINGVLWAVDCRWRDDGWNVDARSVESPLDWLAGYQAFSRNSSKT